MADDQFVRTIVVLPVSSIEESTDWYGKTLGFKTLYVHEGDHAGEATNYAIMQRDSAVVHLILDEPPRVKPWTTAGTGYLYLIVRDADSAFAEVQARNAQIDRGIQVENWGARGFNLTDPSGNAIHIEQPAHLGFENRQGGKLKTDD